MGLPQDNKVVIKSLASGSYFIDGEKISDITLLGYNDKLVWNQDENGLTITMPEIMPCRYAFTFKIISAIKN